LKAEFFYLTATEIPDNCEEMPDLEGKTPDKVRVDAEVNYGSTGSNWPDLSASERFAGRWTGGVKITTGGDYEFCLDSDDGSLLFVNGVFLVDNDGAHGMREVCEEITLQSGSVATVMILFWERLGGAGMIFKYKGPDTGGSKVLVPSSALTQDAPTTTTTTPGGLNAEFFYIPSMADNADVMPDLEGLTPAVVRKDKTVNYGSTGNKWKGLDTADKFAARWTGGVEITQAGDYTFSINSDDGSIFYIDGVKLINNDGPHGMVTMSGTIDLAPGPHNIKLLFWERNGGAGMILSYSGPDTGGSMVVVPSHVLSVEAPTTTTTTPGGLTAEFWYLDSMPNNQQVMPDIEGTPPNEMRIDPEVNYGSTGSNWRGLSKSERFAAKWTGAITIAASGEYTFYINSDDGSLLSLDGMLLCNNDYPHGMATVSGTVELSEGPHAIMLKFWERLGGAGMILSYSGPDTGGSTIVVPSTVLKPEMPDIFGGLTAEFFYIPSMSGSAMYMPELGSLTPDLTRVDPEVNYATTGGTWPGLQEGEKFAARWTGGLKITTPGDYIFSIESDDGSFLYLDEVQLIDNDFPHGMLTKKGTAIGLAAGIHMVKLLFWERLGGAGMIFKYSGPDTSGSEVIVPASVLTPTEPNIYRGLLAGYFFIPSMSNSAEKIPDLSSLTPDLVRVDNKVAYSSTGGHWNGVKDAEKFAALWTGGLRIEESGMYTFYLDSDDGSTLYLDGTLLVHNGGVHPMRTVSNTIELEEGVHSIKMQFFERLGGAGMLFYYSGPDSDGNKVIVPTRVLTPYTPQVFRGLYAEFYYVSSMSTSAMVKPDLTGKEADFTRVDATVNYASTGGAWPALTTGDKFAATWKGGLKIVKPGTYTFSINSDDGSFFVLDGTVLCDNEGPHGMVNVQNEIELAAGVHTVLLEFWERTGGAGMIFSYKGPDSQDMMVVVPATVLTPFEPKLYAGLTGEYFYMPQMSGSQNSMPDVEGLVPDVVRYETPTFANTGDWWPGIGVTERWTTRWTGGLKITTPGVYEFFLNSDDGSILTIDEKEVCNNDGAHAILMKSGAIFLAEGVHSVKLMFFERAGHAGMWLYYSGPDTGNTQQSIPASVLIPFKPKLYRGLTAEYYYLPSMSNSHSSMPNVKDLTPDVKKVEPNVNIGSTSGAWKGLTTGDRYAAVWTGGIKILGAGSYTFSINSDDGSILYIDGQELVNNDGPHGMVTKTAATELSPGVHEVKIEFWERTGGAGMIFSYSGPDTGGSMNVVPTEVLSPFAPTELGLTAEFFYTPPASSCGFPDVSGMTPAVTRVDTGVNYASTGSNWAGLSQGDNFAGRWTGGIEITQGGDYTFYLNSDDGSWFTIDGAILVSNPDCHGMRTREATINLAAGVHPVIVQFTEAGGGAGVIWSYRGPDSGGSTQVVPASVLRPKTPPAEPKGLTVDFYYMNDNNCNVPDFSGRTPDLTRVDSMVNYGSTGSAWMGLARSDNFVAHWHGSIEITTGGDYTFYINSDDGSRMSLDGSEIIGNNDGCHGMQERSAMRNLSPGPHAISLKFFERGGGAGMIFSYSGPDSGNSKQVVPATKLLSS